MANDDNPGSEVMNGETVTSPVETTGAAPVSKQSIEDGVKVYHATSNTSAPPLKKPPSNGLVYQSPSAGNSPRTSRNTSPIRKDSRPQPLSTPSSSQPSAAAIQRALSAANAPQLQATGVADGASKLPRAPRSGENTPKWPTSPRLKSPPPSGSNSRRGSATAQKKVEAPATPNINVQSATPQTSTPSPAKQGGDETAKVQQLQTPGKGPSRGPSGKSTLETVQENSTDDTREPSPAAIQAAADLKPLTKISDDEVQPPKRETAGENEKHTQHGESGSESASTKSDKKKDQNSNNQRPKNAHAKSYNPLTSTKSRPEGKQGMTVETETVQSIPQSALNAGDRSGTRNDNIGSIKAKPSNETIRPKKERKKPSQKARSQGTASTKADIFEARVANAVDEANSSDSDETFVYESNPPEPQRRPGGRHHSRTPSVTSSHSVAEAQRSSGIRSYGDTLDDRRVGGKRSMKFSNNAYTDTDSPDTTKDGSVRSHTPRHFGRFGRGASQASMYDPDSPFTQASKLRSNQLGSRNSRPNSPRSEHGTPKQQRGTSSLFGRKTTHESSYDFDAEGGSETERTPLIGTIRTPRSSRLPRRLSRSNTAASIDEYYGVRRHGRCGRYGGCFLFLVVLAAVIVSAVAFLVMSNRPLYDVRVCRIENVLASEQELMLDLVVGAVNPNALEVKVDDMDVDIFAKSKHVGSGSGSGDDDEELRHSVFRRKRRRAETPSLALPAVNWRDEWEVAGGVDEGTDPPNDDDLEKDAQTMLLGRIFHFDQGLSFEGSPLKRNLHTSVGELRLEKPGNNTETGGSERWEKVLKYEFELIVRGVIKYQLPISSRLERTKISSSIMVYPDDGDERDPEFLRKWRVVSDACEIGDAEGERARSGWFGWS